jgi:hypothetical protein
MRTQLSAIALSLVFFYISLTYALLHFIFKRHFRPCSRLQGAVAMALGLSGKRTGISVGELSHSS